MVLLAAAAGENRRPSLVVVEENLPAAGEMGLAAAGEEHLPEAGEMGLAAAVKMNPAAGEVNSPAAVGWEAAAAAKAAQPLQKRVQASSF